MEHCLTTSRGKTHGKSFRGPRLGLGFSHFLKVASLYFLDIAQDCSLGQCLTSSRAETSKKNLGLKLESKWSFLFYCPEASTQTSLFLLKSTKYFKNLRKILIMQMKIVLRGKYFSCKGYIKLKLAKVPTTFTVKPVLSFLKIFCRD